MRAYAFLAGYMLQISIHHLYEVVLRTGKTLVQGKFDKTNTETILRRTCMGLPSILSVYYTRGSKNMGRAQEEGVKFSNRQYDAHAKGTRASHMAGNGFSCCAISCNEWASLSR